MRANRDLGLLLLGNGVSTLGTSVYLVTVLLLLKDMTESVFLLGLFQFVALIPGFILSPFTGVIVDRRSRRSILIGADVLRGAVMIGAAAALAVPALRTPVLVLAASALVGAGNAFFVPAVQAIIPDIVPREQLQSANGARAATNQGFNLAGNALGGFLYTVLGAPLVFLFNGITFFLSAIQEVAIRAPRDRGRGGQNKRDGRLNARDRQLFLSEVRRGLSAVTGTRGTAVIFLSQAGLFLLSPALLLSLPFIVIDQLTYSGAVVGVFFAVSLAGGITVFLLARYVAVDRLLDAPVIVLAYGVVAILFLALALRINLIVLLGAAYCFGLAAGAVYLYTVTWIQARSDSGLHGRLFSLLEAGNSLVAPVSYVLTGLVLEMLGQSLRHWLFAALSLAAGVWAVGTHLSRSGGPVYNRGRTGV